VAVPPLEEQDAIVEHLQPRVAQLDALAERTRQALALLAEKRQALISAAVTGNLEAVEEVAA
jgi:type I restriction enzyme S subunit